MILLRQKSNDFDERDVGMNCYRIAAFVIAVAVIASVSADAVRMVKALSAHPTPL